jgi:uncharacterized repeat protein (TIGR03803 family)
MNKGIRVVLASGKTCRLIAGILLVLAGRIGSTSGQTLTNIYSFIGTPDGFGQSYAGLVQGSDGNFYGTTPGGTNEPGTVFRISPNGSYTNLYSFPNSYPNGGFPIAGLVQGSDGNFYGTTVIGGAIGSGTIFRMSPGGSLTNLYSFPYSSSDGHNPYGSLVQGSDGNFYGTTHAGGLGNVGAVFRISPSGNYTNLHFFGTSPNDGWRPTGGLVQGSDGNFYGTTTMGGTNEGTVFRISSSGSYTNLYHFPGYPNDGNSPFAGLVQGSDGNFYGTTLSGGTTNFNPKSGFSGYGTIFRISPSGNYTSLYSFVGSPNDGYFPSAGLVQGSDGNFYGTTQGGGTYNNGIIFRISLSGNYSNLYSFAGYPNDGSQPYVGLVQGSDGSFYGTTAFGGINNSGTVYRLSVPLSPPPYPINQITAVQLSGTNIILNIPSIAYETYQLQFSSSMNPTNWVNVPVSVTNSIGALLTLTNFGGALSQGFYRFDITP